MKHILAADDDEAIGALLHDVLSIPAGWNVTTFTSGQALLDTLDTVDPHLVLLDVNMPELDGSAVYRRLRERKGMAEVPIIFVSAASRPPVAGQDGAAHWLAKPFGVAELLATAATLMGVEQ